MTEFEIKEVIKLFCYKRPKIEKGYANQTLHIDLSCGKEIISIKPVDERMKTIFTGGKGFCLKLLWDEVRGANEPGGPTKWHDPDNAICIAAGPLAGVPNMPGSGKSIVTTISPETEMPIDSNVGGDVGNFLKFAGFDALAVTGKTDENTVIFVDGVGDGMIQNAQIIKVANLPDEAYGIAEILTRHPYLSGNVPEDVAVVTAGTAAKNVKISCLNFSLYDTRRDRVKLKQAGRGGIGRIFTDKGLKAIVIRCRKKNITAAANNPADLQRLLKAATAHSDEIVKLDPKQNEMRTIGTTHLTPYMNNAECLPINNFQFGSHPNAAMLGPEVFRKMFHKGYDGCCKGCQVACAHCIKDFVLRTGPFKGKKAFIDGPEYETIAACTAMGIFNPGFAAEYNFYCDTYGLDTISTGVSVAFAMECCHRGLINPNMDIFFGNEKTAMEIVHQMARGEGFGYIVGQGVRNMKKVFTNRYGADPAILNDIGMESKGLEFSMYISKESLAQQGGYGLALKGPQHDEAWLIFLDMVHNLIPTFEQKAEYLYWFPMWRTWFSLCGLCKLPWNDIVPEDNQNAPEPAKVMKHVRWYAEYFSAMTGREAGPDDLITMSERVYNFQRVFNLRMGFGRREHDTLPYRAMGPVTTEEYESRQEYYDQKVESLKGSHDISCDIQEKIRLLRLHREQMYEKLKDAAYKHRGWKKNGVPMIRRVKSLGIDFPEILAAIKELGR